MYILIKNSESDIFTFFRSSRYSMNTIHVRLGFLRKCVFLLEVFLVYILIFSSTRFILISDRQSQNMVSNNNLFINSANPFLRIRPFITFFSSAVKENKRKSDNVEAEWE